MRSALSTPVALPLRDDPPPYDFFKQASAAPSTVSLAGSVAFSVVDVRNNNVPPVPPIPPEVGAMVGAMATDKRPVWKRGASMRRNGSTSAPSQRPPQPPSSGPQRLKTTGRADEDGYVPYRPPFATRSTNSLLAPPVQPSGAQGIGLAPSTTVPLFDDDVEEKHSRRSIFRGWPFSITKGRRRKQSMASVSTPHLLHPAASTASFGTTYAGFGGHVPTHARNRSRGHHPELPPGGGHSNHLGTTFSAYAPRGKQFVSSQPPSQMNQSPSVLTGLSAPKMLFSPLARTLRPVGSAPPGISNHIPYHSTPNLPSPPPSDSNVNVENVVPETRPYPRVGDNNVHGNYLSKHSASWTNLAPNPSSVTLHSEGSRSRLAVTTVCDALTFPRPRMNAHEITPPDSPQNDPPDIDDDDNDIGFSDAVAQSKAREAEREEWAEFARSGRSNSIRRSYESVSAPATPRGLRHRLSESRYSLNRTPKSTPHRRSHSQSSSIRSFFSRQRSNSQRRPNEEPVSDHTASFDSIHTPVRSQSQRSRRGTGIFASLMTPTHGTIHKSTSSPQLSSTEDGDVSSPKRSQSMRYGSSRSNPDVVSKDKAQTVTGVPGSQKHDRRPSGPPRSFQFRLQPHQVRNGSVHSQGTGVVVVGPSPTVSSVATRTPRTIDFAEPNRGRAVTPPPVPDAVPMLPTPERGAPFSFDSNEIGVAITTIGDEAALPTSRVERQPVHQAGLQQPAVTREPPSSAHARYLLARQHRRSMTIRAFQSPAMPHPHTRQPSTDAPNFAAPPVAPSFGSHRRKRSSPPPPLPYVYTGYTHAIDGEPPLSPTSPVSPRSPVSPEGKARGTSSLGPRAGGRIPRLRPRGSSGASSASGTSSPPRRRLSLSPKGGIVPLPDMAETFKAPLPLRTDKDLPPVPISPAETPSGTLTPMPAVPEPTQLMPSVVLVPMRPPAPTRPVPQPPVSPGALSDASASPPDFRRRTGSSGMLTALAATAAEVNALSRADTPPNARTPSPSAWEEPTTGPPPPPKPPARTQTLTPPPHTILPTIMDESPTPSRQRTVSVLAPPPESPTPVSMAGTPTGTWMGGTPARPPYSGNPFSSLRTSRPRSPKPDDVHPIQDPAARQSMPPRLESSSSIVSNKSHRSMPSVSAVIPSPELFRGELSTEADSQYSRVSPDFFSHKLIPRSGSDNKLRQVRTVSSTSAALPDTSGVLGNADLSGIEPVPPLPQKAMELVADQEMEVLRRFRMSSTNESRTTSPDDGGPIRPPVSRHQSVSSIMDSALGHESAMSHTSFFTTEAFSEAPSVSPEPEPMPGMPFGSRAARAFPADDNDVENSDARSDTTLPDLFPQSSTSQLSHYTDAEEGSQEGSQEASVFVSPAEDLPENAMLPPINLVSEDAEDGDDTPHAGSIVRLDSDDEKSPKNRPGTSASDNVENLSATPRPVQKEASPANDSDDAFEFDPKAVRRLSGGSMSSSSEVSIRQSLDENFRGLFYRPPQVASPEKSIRGPRRRLPSHLSQSFVVRPSPPQKAKEFGDTRTVTINSASTLGNSPIDRASEASAYELRTPVAANQAKFAIPRTASDGRLDFLSTGPTAGAGTLAPPSPIPQGLGVSITTGPGGPVSFLAGFDVNRISRASPPPDPQALVPVVPRDDSWITESYHRLSQVVARSATPSRNASLRKPRPFSAPFDDQGVPFSPTTFGVNTERFNDSPGPSTPLSVSVAASIRQTASSGSSVVDPASPHPDAVVEKFPTPPPTHYSPNPNRS